MWYRASRHTAGFVRCASVTGAALLAVTFAGRAGAQARPAGAGDSAAARPPALPTTRPPVTTGGTQGGGGAVPGTTAAQPTAATLPPYDGVQVIKVRRLNRKVSLDTAGPRADDIVPLPRDSVVEAGMDDILVVVVKHLRNLVARSQCRDLQDKPVPITDCRPEKLVLYLDGRAIKGLEPESGAPIPGDSIGTLQFHLARSDTSDEAWADLLGGPPLGDEQFWRRPTQVSVGLENAFPVNADPVYGRFALRRIYEGWFWPSLVVYLAILFAFARYARESDVLRDMGPDPVLPDGKTGRKPYSLARVQMAWWFFWVVGGFFFVFLINRSYDTITTTALALIGISAGTLLGSASIDAGRRASTGGELATLEAQEEALDAEIASLDKEIAAATVAAAPGLPTLQDARRLKTAERHALQQQLRRAMMAAAPPVTQGLWRDILSDPQGQSFHRFQMVVWTLVLTVLFVVSVYRRLAMPEFNTTLLALLGISNGLYLGFKAAPDLQQPTAAPVGAPPR